MSVRRNSFTTPRLPTPVTDPLFRRTRYHLTPDQVRFFDQNGFLILPQWIPPALVARLQDASNDWIRQGQAPEVQRSWRWDADYVARPGNSGSELIRVNYLHDKGNPASLELLGAPQVLALAESLCGINFVPTYESLIVYHEGGNQMDCWHQNAIHSRNWRIFNMAVCLDPLHRGDGAFALAPGTQWERRLSANPKYSNGWNISNTIMVEMEPGDVLLHDVMLVQGLPQPQNNSLRRMLYFEFRSADQILTEGPWDRDWVDRRLRLLQAAILRGALASPDADPFHWQICPAYRPMPLYAQPLDLKVPHFWHTAGAVSARKKPRSLRGR